MHAVESAYAWQTIAILATLAALLCGAGFVAVMFRFVIKTPEDGGPGDTSGVKHD